MSKLLSILQDAGHEDLPKDWRTVLNRCALEDAALRDDSLSERSSQRQSYDTLTLVCGACWLAPFSEAQLEAALTCATCDVSTVQCSRLSCRERCVVITRLGKKSLDTLEPCSVCLMSSTSLSTHSSYHWSLKRYIRDAFADRFQCLKFLSPFCNLFETASKANGDPNLFFRETWLKDWLLSLGRCPVSSQLFHDIRFSRNPVWLEHGPRSLILLVESTLLVC